MVLQNDVEMGLDRFSSEANKTYSIKYIIQTHKKNLSASKWLNINLPILVF